MHAVCEDFDKYFSAWNQDIYRLCFAMVGKAGDARDLTFKTFLRLGAAKDPEMKEKDAKNLLFSSCFTLCVDSFGQKMRRMPNRKALESMNLPFPVTDSLYVFLKRPLMQRGALCLAQSGFSEAEIAKIASRSAAQFACSSTPEAVSARFEERSVGVENAIHDFRIRFDRLAPYLALAVLVLFAVAVYVSFKMAG